MDSVSFKFFDKERRRRLISKLRTRAYRAALKSAASSPGADANAGSLGAASAVDGQTQKSRLAPSRKRNSADLERIRSNIAAAGLLALATPRGDESGSHGGDFVLSVPFPAAASHRRGGGDGGSLASSQLFGAASATAVDADSVENGIDGGGGGGGRGVHNLGRKQKTPRHSSDVGSARKKAASRPETLVEPAAATAGYSLDGEDAEEASGAVSAFMSAFSRGSGTSISPLSSFPCCALPSCAFLRFGSWAEAATHQRAAHAAQHAGAPSMCAFCGRACATPTHRRQHEADHVVEFACTGGGARGGGGGAGCSFTAATEAELQGHMAGGGGGGGCVAGSSALAAAGTLGSLKRAFSSSSGRGDLYVPLPQAKVAKGEAV